MEFGNRVSVWASCADLGVTAVRAQVQAGSFGAQSAFPIEWLLEQEQVRHKAREAEERERNARAWAAAESSARASEQAAEALLRSTRWTMWAGVAALLSAAVSALTQYFPK